MARPRIQIDIKTFENLCGLMCTLPEIAGFIGCSEDTIERWCKRTYDESFAEVHKKKSANGKISLRRSQFRMAETNATMAIWLGKQYLGQTDKQITQVQMLEDDPLSIAFKELTNVQQEAD